MPGITPLFDLGVPAYIGKIQTQMAMADALQGIGAPGVPGLPDVPKLVTDAIGKIAEAAAEALKILLIAFVIAILMGAFLNNIPALNKMIDKINNILKKIKSALDTCMNILKPIFPLIIVVAVFVIITKVLSMIPIFGAGMGAVVSVGVPQSMANQGNAAAVVVNETKLKPIPYKVIAIMSMLLMLVSFAFLVMGFANSFTEQQKALSEDALNSKKKTAGKPTTPVVGGAGAFGAGGDGAINNVLSRGAGDKLGACTLPDGTVSQMTAADCALAGGIWAGVTSGEWTLVTGDGNLGKPDDSDSSNIPPKVSSPYTDKNRDVWIYGSDLSGFGLDNLLGGKSEKEKLGIRLGLHLQINKLDDSDESKILKFGLESELNKLGGAPTDNEIGRVMSDSDIEDINNMFDKLGSTIINSLLYKDDDVTVGKAKARTGKRKTFYQQNVKE